VLILWRLAMKNNVRLVPKKLIEENFSVSVRTKKVIIFVLKSVNKIFELLSATVAETKLKKLKTFTMLMKTAKKVCFVLPVLQLNAKLAKECLFQLKLPFRAIFCPMSENYRQPKNYRLWLRFVKFVA
jgi:hypothetical protein